MEVKEEATINNTDENKMDVEEAREDKEAEQKEEAVIKIEEIKSEIDTNTDESESEPVKESKDKTTTAERSNPTSGSSSNSSRHMPENGEIVVLDSKSARRRDKDGEETSALITKAEAEEAVAAADREVLERTIKSCGEHILNGRTVRGDLFIEHDDEEEPVCGAGWWDSINSYETDTFVSPGSLEAALAASEVVCHAVDLIVADN